MEHDKFSISHGIVHDGIRYATIVTTQEYKDIAERFAWAHGWTPCDGIVYNSGIAVIGLRKLTAK